jgi:hypothetical protein
VPDHRISLRHPNDDQASRQTNLPPEPANLRAIDRTARRNPLACIVGRAAQPKIAVGQCSLSVTAIAGVGVDSCSGQIPVLPAANEIVLSRLRLIASLPGALAPPSSSELSERRGAHWSGARHHVRRGHLAGRFCLARALQLGEGGSRVLEKPRVLLPVDHLA